MKYFDKLCTKCGEMKHISKFRSAGGKTRKLCNECVVSKRLTCVTCGKDKPIVDFYTHSRVYNECHECKNKSQLLVEQRMDEALLAIHCKARGVNENANQEV